MGTESNNNVILLPASRGISRSQNFYQKLKRNVKSQAFQLVAGFVVLPGFATLTVGTSPHGINGSIIRQLGDASRAPQPSLSQAEVLLKNAQELERHLQRADLKPTRNMGVDFTEAQKDMLAFVGKPLPALTPTIPAPRAPEVQWPELNLDI